ncbi:MAG: transcriptional repressor [Desulfobacterales bacterium]|nr:transcriptional repressor [Desulfobacterales bacterium]
MCIHCDYNEILSSVSLDPTRNRLRVLEVVGNNRFPLSASDIHETLERTTPINRVTVYRILDLLVEKGVVDRISTGGRAAYYGLAPNRHHQAHPHFYCTACGQMDCLDPGALSVEFQQFADTFPGRIDKLEMRLDGICKNCLKRSQ